jgi:hypothetical protein
MLSCSKYSGLCVLGTEIFYILCLPFGLLLSAKGRELHASLFELIPGFAWGAPMSMVWGGVFLAILAAIGGWYVAWMHNTSLVSKSH